MSNWGFLKFKQVLISQIFLFFLVGGAVIARAAIESYPFDDEQQQKQFNSLIVELRCPKCQNQSLADSNSDIARDLKDKVHDLVVSGNTDEQIMKYLVARYGDFITYQPPVRVNTLLLWSGPLLILLVSLAVAFFRVRAQGRQAPSDRQTNAVDESHLSELRAQMGLPSAKNDPETISEDSSKR